MGILKALSIVSQIYQLFPTKLLYMYPLNITHTASAHLLFTKVNHTGKYWIIEKPILGDNKLYLTYTASLINVTNIDLNHSKAVKSDNALTDDSMWNLSALIPVSGIDPSSYPSLSKDYYNSTHSVVFSWIRDNMSRRFSVNANNSAEWYLGLTYYPEEIVINPGINLRAAVINSNVSVSPRRYYHTYRDIIIHTTTSNTIVRVYNHE